MANVFALFHFLLSITFTSFFSLTYTTTTTITTPRSLVVKLIHRDSVLHPDYNANETISDRAEREMKNSMLRFANLQAKTQGSFATNDVQAILEPSMYGALFLANFSIGQPPIAQLAAVDTGSNLMWVQCVPCNNCFQKSGPMLDPSKSSTYANVPCNSPSCDHYLGYRCTGFNRCTYNKTYVDLTNSIGILASEQLLFETSDDGKIMVPDVIFGCSHKNTANIDMKWSGIIGLGPLPLSLASQLGNKFSYCIGSLTDPKYKYNHLILGHGANIEGCSTPVETFRGFYYLTLEGISVGERRLEINPNIFRRTLDGNGGVIIDSGCTYTGLVKGGFEALSNGIQNLIQESLTRIIHKNKPWQLCYKGTIEQDLVGFPVVTFHFAGGTDLVLDPGSLFRQVRDYEFCMAVIPRSPERSSTIGILAQQNYNVAYNLDERKIYFQRIDCELLFE